MLKIKARAIPQFKDIFTPESIESSTPKSISAFTGFGKKKP
jgi:hypothetical protein